MKTQELVAKISSLPIDQRAKAVDQILQSFNRPDPDIEKMWNKEVKRRAAQVKSSEAELVPADEVFEGLSEITGP